MTREELEKMLDHVAAVTKMLAKPIDFAALESRGLISRAGSWYRVHNIRELPEHVAKKITAFEQDAKGVKVKFGKASSFEKLSKRFEKMEAKRKPKSKGR